MTQRIALLAIIVEKASAVNELNTLLHRYADYIIGRMGLPYRAKKISIISIALDAPEDIIAALSGAIGRLEGVSCKVAYSNFIS